MWRTAAWMCACAALSAATHNAHTDTTADTNYLRKFTRDGNILTIEFVKPLKEHCTDWTTLDSMALQPSFRSEPYHCAGSCYMNTVEYLNVTGLQPSPALQPLEQCDALHEFILRAPAVEALPERLLARCPQVEVFRVIYADRLVTLPSKLLENATSLRDLWITHGVLETLPAGLLDDVPNLIFINLEFNRLQTLPSGLFLNQGKLLSLHLSSNLLRTEAVTELVGLHSLETLELSNNTHLTDLCNSSSDYSPLLHLKKLRYLYLPVTSITHTCRDWRQNLTSLKQLELASTKITEIQLSDLQYTRDESVSEEATVSFSVTYIRYTEEEYNTSLVAPRNGADVTLWAEQCDCKKKWVPFTLFPNRSVPHDASATSATSARVYVQKCLQDNATCQSPTLLAHSDRR